jgi:hypothetical protein
MTPLDVLQQCSVEGNVVRLPNVQLDRETYKEVAKKLELIGGKWKGGKIAGFVFPQDPTVLLEQIATGENRNLKKEFQFFATPSALADKLVQLAEIKAGHFVLEPSAGQGAIVEAVTKQFPDMLVDCFELMDINREILKRKPGALIIGDDFFKIKEYDRVEYDRIIANPPFSKNQDIDHIVKMYDVLAEGGRLVSIASKHWQLSSNKKEIQFREWLKSLGAEVIDIEAGAFKDSGTMISSCIIVIDKQRY